MIPTEQTCPICNHPFMGSDMVGFPCTECQMGEQLSPAIYDQISLVHKHNANIKKPAVKINLDELRKGGL